MAPKITLRILGKSVNHTQPNDLLWFLTMNQTKVSADLASRGMPIRLYYEGDPATRVFEGPHPLEYALEYRAEILGELFGLVELWKSRGRLLGSRQHRCEHWAQVIGGILESCGYPEFLGNAAEAAAEFNTELGELAASLKAWRGPAKDPRSSWMRTGRRQTGRTGETRNFQRGSQPEIGSIFSARESGNRAAGRRQERRSRATIMGSFLARLVDREVPIDVEGRAARATLRSTMGRCGPRCTTLKSALRTMAHPGSGPEFDQQMPSDGPLPPPGDPGRNHRHWPV